MLRSILSVKPDLQPHLTESLWYPPKAIYQINERREVPISTEVAVNAASTRMTHLQRDSELNSPRSRDETSRASPAVIQA